MSELWGTVTPEGILVGRVAADFVLPEGSDLVLVEPVIADAMPQPPVPPPPEPAPEPEPEPEPAPE